MEVSKKARIALFIMFFMFFIGILKYRPYNSYVVLENFTIEHIFHLYFFLVNQTLGIVHEGGHGVCYVLPCPEFFMVINGTIFQWAFPLGIGLYYLKRKNKIGFYASLFFLGISIKYTAWYISTANQGLYVPAHKSFLGVDGYHDFNYILTHLNLLEYYNFISGFVNFLSIVLMLISIVWFFFNAFLKKEKIN